MTILTYEQAESRARELRDNRGSDLLWSGLSLPESISEGHFCIVGGTGSGKTVTLLQLMQSVLPRFKPRSGRRAVIYDAKQNILPLLDEMGLTVPVVVLNPFDQRCVAWDIAKDVTSPAEAMIVAGILVEEEEGPNQFFTMAARALVGNVLKAFTLVAPKTWTLADVIDALKSKDRVRELLTRHPLTTNAYHEYFERREIAAGNVELTIRATVEKLEPIAAPWSRTSSRMSLHDFLRGEFVLVLGRNAEFHPSLDALNRIIFDRLAQLALGQPATHEAKTWFFFDDVWQAGRLEGINSLIVEGRPRGVRVTIAFPDIDRLRGVYGEIAANELAGACRNKAILRLDSESTALWAGQLISDADVGEHTTTETGTTGSESIVRSEAVLASELLGLRAPAKQGFRGYFITQGIGIHAGSVRFGPAD